MLLMFDKVRAQSVNIGIHRIWSKLNANGRH